jgi:hypothetical protein
VAILLVLSGALLALVTIISGGGKDHRKAR